MSPAAAIAVDAPAAVAAKATYALEELTRVSAASAPVSYPSAALPASEAAWRLFWGRTSRRRGRATTGWSTSATGPPTSS